MSRYAFARPALPLALVAVLSAACLGSESMWLDESYSVAFSHLSWPAFWTLITSLETNMSLYHAMLKVWVGVFGDSEIAVRSLSAAFAVLSVAASFAAFRRLFGEKAALLSSVLLASNAFLIRFAQEARGYTLLLFLATSSMYIFVTAVERRDPKRYAALAFVNALVLYAHFFGVFVLLTQVISLLLAPRRLVEWRRLILVYLISGLLTAPLAASVLLSPGANPWAWADPLTARAVAATMNALTGGGLPIALAAYFICCLLSLAYAAGKVRKAGEETFRWSYALTLLWLFVPVVILLMIALLVPAFQDRYLITTLPALSALAAIGVLAIRNRQLQWAAVAALLLASLYNVVDQHGTLSKRDWRAATERVLASSRSGDAVLFYGWMAKYPFEYYYRRSVDRAAIADRLICVWPSAFEAPSSPANVSAHLRLVTNYAEPDTQFLSSLAGKHGRLWVVLAMDDIEGMGLHSTPVVEQIGRHYQPREEVKLDRIRIIRFEALAASRQSGHGERNQ